jgi:hypothetical protein
LLLASNPVIVATQFVAASTRFVPVMTVEAMAAF